MKRKSCCALVSSLVLVTVQAAEPPAGASVSAPPAEGTAVPVETFTGPAPVNLAQPRYPRNRVYLQEGWVRLNFMVDTEGKPYEVVVSSAVGDEAFQKAAKRALRRSVFEPARLNGEPIEAGHALTYRFSLRGADPAARRHFAATYRRVSEAIESDDRERADRLLQDLDAENLYESAYVELGRYLYYRKWGTRQQQLTALRRALGHDDDPPYLPDELFAQVLQVLFALQLEVHDFGGALRTADRLQKLDLGDDLQVELQTATARIRAFQADHRPYAVEGNINASSTSWFLWLLRPRFRPQDSRRGAPHPARSARLKP